jgi:hypothetical protein
MSEQNKEEILDIEGQIEDLLSGIDKLPPFEIELEQYDLEGFDKGIKDTSYTVGVITALFNAGFSESSVLDYLLSTETIKHNLEVAKINKETSIEMSKNQKAAQEKYEL